MSIVQSAGGSNQHNAAGIVRPIYSAVVSTVVLVRVRVPVSALLVQTGYSLGTMAAIYFLSPDYHFFQWSEKLQLGAFAERTLGSESMQSRSHSAAAGYSSSDTPTP